MSTELAVVLTYAPTFREVLPAALSFSVEAPGSVCEVYRFLFYFSRTSQKLLGLFCWFPFLINQFLLSHVLCLRLPFIGSFIFVRELSSPYWFYPARLLFTFQRLQGVVSSTPPNLASLLEVYGTEPRSHVFVPALFRIQTDNLPSLVLATASSCQLTLAYALANQQRFAVVPNFEFYASAPPICRTSS